ncbi:hypothetical protein [Allobranchiibius sp. CTAmp26]|uniref:hypothetical protein n=1 Tax=Allobranchiibius sp. CTAmp26 TaxID=2815214 RepID=UPI001AA0E977|nr:hypothetical protein [Allobranchiibius sp. CTAmp26]MBO1756539.1 hypothetical protein [Allobranchiibius sp. CTAmp26]
MKDLAVQVLVAIRERDAVVLDADRRAGRALTEMIDTGRLTAHEAARWCGDEVNAREVARLRRAAEATNPADLEGP